MVSEKPPISGLSARLSVKTCFRIGEALRVGGMVKEGHFRGDVLVELYGIGCYLSDHLPSIHGCLNIHMLTKQEK